MSNEKEIETVFTVVLNKDASINVLVDAPEKPIVGERQAINADIYKFAKQVVEEFDRGLLIEALVNALTPILVPQEEAALPEKVKEALKERGITPEGE
jgi:hypothetical protein